MDASPPAVPQRVVPTDDRPARHGDVRALPISGGTLLVTADGAWAVAADPERDRVSILDLQRSVLSSTIALTPGDEPGRLVEDDRGRVHVVLRRGGAVVTLDPATHAILDRRAVCASPRGIAFDRDARALRVACASGDFLTLPVDGGPVAAKTALGLDLRDVVVHRGTTLVTRFKSAELIQVDASGQPSATNRPPVLVGSFPEASGAQVGDALDPEMAFRARLGLDGFVYVAHEAARTGEVDIRASAMEPNAPPTQSPYGEVTDTCSGIVWTVVSTFDGDGHYVGTTRLNAVLAVDVDASPGMVVVAEAGARDPIQPEVTFVTQGGGPALPPSPQPLIGAALPGTPAFTTPSAPSTGRVIVYDASSVQKGQGASGCLAPRMTVDHEGQVTAVAITPDALHAIAQSREPAALWIIDLFPSGGTAEDAGATSDLTVVDLGGGSAYDTGHELFHRAPGASLACASCHPEGGEDGHVWTFSGQGKRRTQALHVGLEGTEPFHWDGELADLDALTEEVLVSRMGGVHESPARRGALQEFLFSLTPPAPLRAKDDPAVLRGKTIFEGTGGCLECHSGSKFTNDQTVDVGTGKAFQVPSLIGVGYRGPWLHDGCAKTLRDRFVPACGGDRHGNVSGLASPELDDLVAYLESL